jgi:hypothetical protein
MLQAIPIMKPTRLLIVALLALAPGACNNTRKPKAPPTPPPTYTGPEFFRTTIASQCALRGYEPVLVSGFGLVVNLNGTGSPDVPPQIAQWLINEMSKGGFGKTSLGFGHLTPREVLNSDRTAVVVVEALIPPGATPGATFDAVVTALPGTQTTSLEGGLLYTTELRFSGTSTNTPSSRPLARTYGPVFLNPFVKPEPLAFGGRSDNARVGQVLNGAVAVTEMPLALILNQPSYTRSRMIADRINGRFRQADVDKFPMAVATDNKTIVLHVLDRFKSDPQRMLDLIGRLYLNPTERFARDQAQRLIDELAKPENHKHADGITTAWEGMGKLILPVIRKAYNHADPVVRLASLSAGARLGDLLAAPQPLNAIASAPEGGRDAERATAMLGTLLAYNPDHTRTRFMLRRLLDADDARVRMTAFSALFNAGERAPYIIYRDNPGRCNSRWCGRTSRWSTSLARARRASWCSTRCSGSTIRCSRRCGTTA